MAQIIPVAAFSGKDASAEIQAYLNRGPGEYRLATGGFNVAGGIVLPPGVSLIGDGMFATLLEGHVAFAPNDGQGQGLRGLGIAASRNDLEINAIQIPSGVVAAAVDNVLAQGGASPLYIAGVDCCFSNCYFRDGYGDAAVVSNGANWYIRCKIDSQIPIACGFLQGDAVPHDSIIENHFWGCDFSGPYSYAVRIEDTYNQAVTVFDGCIFGASIRVRGAKWTCISTSELSGDVLNEAGSPLTVAASWSSGKTVLRGSGIVSAGNQPNISTSF